jgi:hypothetical protein
MGDIPSAATALACRRYATLICRARRMARLPHASARDLRTRLLMDAARQVYEAAPNEALPYLDTVKRILEIDSYQMNPAIILMRASVNGVKGNLS